MRCPKLKTPAVLATAVIDTNAQGNVHNIAVRPRVGGRTRKRLSDQESTTTRSDSDKANPISPADVDARHPHPVRSGDAPLAD